jgi:RimJ/RimL family protein N-acetyltransferase
MPSVRRLTADDAEIFRALRLEALTMAPDAFVATIEEYHGRPLSWFVERLTEDAIFAAFNDKNEAVGMAGFTRMKSGRESHKGLVWTMYLRESERGRGIAGELLRAVIEHARGKVEVLQLAVVSTNAAAVALYEKHGFRRWGLEPFALRTGEGVYTEDAHYWLPLKDQ